MGRSNALRLHDIRAVFRLIGDCRDLGHDLAGWYPRAIEGLRSLTGSVMVCGGVFSNLGANPIVVGRNLWDVGWPSERDRRTWMDMVISRRNLEHTTVVRVFQMRGRLICCTRRQLVPDDEWYRSAEYADRSGVGQDDTMIGLHWHGRPPTLQNFSLNRAVGDGRFQVRDQKMFRLFHDEIIRLFDRELVVNAEEPFGSLPPRLRQVLEGLKDGDSEKQVAFRLGLSRHTVHEYVTSLYRRFGVGSRGELLKLYWRRGDA